MVLNDQLEELSVVVELDSFGDIISDLLSHGHALHQVHIHQLLLDVVFNCAHFQRGYSLLVLIYLLVGSSLLLIVVGLPFTQQQHLSLSPFNLKNV